MEITRVSKKRIVLIAFGLAALVVLPMGSWLLYESARETPSFGDIFHGPYNTADYSFEFERTPCFGECPVFNLLIAKDGTAVLKVPADRRFEGILNVPDIRDIRYSKKLSIEARMELIQTAEKGGFWKMDSNYSFQVTDMPGQDIAVQSKDRSWQVNVYAVPCVTEARNLKNSYMDDWNFEKLVPDVFCELEKKLDAVVCDVYQTGARSGDDAIEAIWPPRCNTNT